VNLSEGSEAVVACARGLAGPGGTLVVLHVAAPDPDFVGYEAGPSSVRQNVAADLRSEHRGLQRLADAARGPDLEPTPLFVQGPTAEMILEHAARLRADFVVVGSRKHGALHDFLVGSTVRELLRNSTVPVVVVPSPSK